MSLQYGVPLEVLVNKFSHTRFEPMGLTKNPDIRIAKSVVDYIFRWMGMTFLEGYREASNGLPPKTVEGEEPTDSKPAAMKAGGQNGQRTANQSATQLELTNGKRQSNTAMLERAGVAIVVDQNSGGIEGRSDQFARFQSDAPACDNCGAITVRNGNCYLCHNCGNSMGCS